MKNTRLHQIHWMKSYTCLLLVCAADSKNAVCFAWVFIYLYFYYYMYKSVLLCVLLSHQLHIVHMKQRYNRLEDALRDPSGIAVLGFFYEVWNACALKSRHMSLFSSLRDDFEFAQWKINIVSNFQESSSSNRKYDLFTHGLRSIQNTSKTTTSICTTCLLYYSNIPHMTCYRSTQTVILTWFEYVHFWYLYILNIYRWCSFTSCECIGCTIRVKFN